VHLIGTTQPVDAILTVRDFVQYYSGELLGPSYHFDCQNVVKKVDFVTKVRLKDINRHT
jgi:hypothetical protein